MRKKLQKKGFEVIAVNAEDEEKLVSDYWKKSKFKIPVVLNGVEVFKAYNVRAMPTNYLIGKNGKVLARFEGFDEAGIKKTLAKAGIK